jgi:hypothetical protein
MGRTACTEPQCLYKGALVYFLHYLKFNSGFMGMQYENYHAIITLNRFKELLTSNYDIVRLELKMYILFT